MLVQDYLRVGKTLDDLEREYAVTATRHRTYENLVLLKYSQIESPRTHPVVTECRGVILDRDADWKVVARPFDRFFNYGEGHAAQIDWASAKVYEKLDGSLMTLYWYDGKWQVASSGSPDASGPVNNDSSMTFKDLFWRTWNELGYDYPTQKSPCCYMFELMTPLNRVVVPHSCHRLVLHGVRQLITGHPGYDYNELDPVAIAGVNGWEAVQTYPLTNMAQVYEASTKLNPMQQEGFVVVDAHFNRIKVKSPQYVAIHHMADGFSDRRMLEIVRTNEGTEFLNYFSEYRPIYERIKAKYDALVEDIESTYARIKDIPEQKAFALEATKTACPGALFALRGGKAATAKDYLASVSMQALERHI